MAFGFIKLCLLSPGVSASADVSISGRVNLIMDSLASLALATEAPTDAVLDLPPYSPSQPLLTPSVRALPGPMHSAKPPRNSPLPTPRSASLVRACQSSCPCIDAVLCQPV